MKSCRPGPALRERPATPASIGRSRGEEARPASSEARIALLRSVAWLRHPAAALLPGRHIRLCRASEDRRSVQAIGRGRPTERNPFHISHHGRLPDRTRIGSLSDLQAQRFLNFQNRRAATRRSRSHLEAAAWSHSTRSAHTRAARSDTTRASACSRVHATARSSTRLERPRSCPVPRRLRCRRSGSRWEPTGACTPAEQQRPVDHLPSHAVRLWDPLAIREFSALVGAPLADWTDLAAVTHHAVGVVTTANELVFGRRLNSEGRFTYDLKLPPSVPTTSIYTKTDDVVNYRSCLRPDIPALPVWGSHNGLVVNPEVFRLVGRLLARPRRQA